MLLVMSSEADGKNSRRCGETWRATVAWYIAITCFYNHCGENETWKTNETNYTEHFAYDLPSFI